MDEDVGCPSNAGAIFLEPCLGWELNGEHFIPRSAGVGPNQTQPNEITWGLNHVSQPPAKQNTGVSCAVNRLVGKGADLGLERMSPRMWNPLEKT